MRSSSAKMATLRRASRGVATFSGHPCRHFFIWRRARPATISIEQVHSGRDFRQILSLGPQCENLGFGSNVRGNGKLAGMETCHSTAKARLRAKNLRNRFQDLGKAPLENRSATAGAGAGGASETMVAGEDFAVFGCGGIELPKMQRAISTLPVDL